MLTLSAGVRDRVDLARAAPFTLGDIDVFPSVRQLTRHDASETLEPRVMQVLVALARAEGAVVTRDQLIDWCWDGRIVSENAINRVISRLRQVAAEFAGGAFQLETITKVGYRLVVHAQPVRDEAPLATPAPSISTPEASGKTLPMQSRRAILGGLTIVSVFAAATGASRLSLFGGGGSGSTAALDLYNKGVETRAQGTANMVGQAEAYFAQAVEADPRLAPAWAALALARAGQLNWEQGADQEMMAARARFAAQRALQIDPRSGEAQTALAFIPSMFARWAAAEADYRRLLTLPTLTPFAEWVVRARLAKCLASVGRCREAVREFRPAAAILPDHSFSSVGLTQALWMAGDAVGARAESDRAIVRFPRHADVWFTRMALLTFGSRPEEAVAFGRDNAQLPFRENGEGLIYRRVITARALLELKPDLVERASRLHLASVAADWEETPAAARFFAALGQFDILFDLLRGYYLHEGPFADPRRPAHNALTRYALAELFWPPMAPAWSDPRFAELTRRIGLQSYWQATGRRPDFRIA